jgi:hypothetical protein
MQLPIAIVTSGLHGENDYCVTISARIMLLFARASFEWFAKWLAARRWTYGQFQICSIDLERNLVATNVST